MAVGLWLQAADNVEAHSCRAVVSVHHLADTAWVAVGANANDRDPPCSQMQPVTQICD